MIAFVALAAFVVGAAVASYLERKYSTEIAGAISDVRSDVAFVKGKVAKL
ncbi:MAG TPA: hypothetical protein VMH37_09755 [Candidatus Binataceae bacterium]|nr:hypothetical protein [Candidatus Binataceae bacterium]